MFAKIAAFELRYQMKNPVFWVVSILFFLLTFGAVTADGIQIGSGGNVHINSPAAIIETHLIITLFFMFVTTAFVANVIVRDDESGFGPMVRSTRVRKFDYLMGRFTGAFLIAAIAFLVVPLAMWIGSMMPWLDQDSLGPNNPVHYAYAYFIMALPGVFLTSSIFFAVATVTRSMMYSYVAVVVFLVLYLVLNVVLTTKPELRDLASYIEPFGLGAIANATRYWTASESNTMLPALAGPILINRLIWLAVSCAALVFAYRRFRFADTGVSARKAKREAQKAAKLANVPPQIVSILPKGNARTAKWAHLIARTRFETAQLINSPAFAVLIMIGLFNAFGSLVFANEIYGTPSRPLTFALIPRLIGSFGIIPIIIAIYYAGELVWRDRERKIHEIIDSTPLPNWAYMVPKTIAVSAVLFASIAVSIIAAVMIQLVRGFSDLALEQYILWYLLPWGVDMIILSVLAVFIQALSPNKYIGWGMMVLYLVATITFALLGFEHPLYLYGEGAPDILISDLNGNNVNGMAGWWMRLYWGAIAIILVALAHLLWRRGTGMSLRPRLRQLPRRLISITGALITGAGLTAAATGAFVYNNTNVMNEFATQDDTDKRLAEYEKKYLQYETVKQPSTTDITLNIDIYPEAKRMTVAGEMVIVNDTGAPVEALHIRLATIETNVDSITVPNARLTLDDPEMHYWIYTLDTPMALDETRTISFRTSRQQKGFKSSGNDSRLVLNGTFLDNSEFQPRLGMDRNGLLSDRQKRREYGLEPELRLPKLEDESAREQNYVGNVDWVMSDITISTHKDQTPIAPGSRVFDDIKGDRRTARFVSQQPILAFFSVQSAQYAVRERTADGVNIAVYYHPKHDYNIDTMIDATEQSLAYYTANFGPYQFDYARIIEFPGYASFAQAFAGTVPYSENLGFIADSSDPDDIDYVTYITAHEFGHQYWAHQLISANQQGGTMLVESMAQYSALMVMKQIYGEDKIRRFLKYELDRYLAMRGSEVIEELPLNRVEDQDYIHYRKGAVALYLLQDRLGENRVNAMLADLLNRYRFKSQPYASSTDLVDGFKSLARNDIERELITDLLEKITIYDLKADTVEVRALDNGRFETKITVIADKYYADGQGRETKARLRDMIEIGLFTAQPGMGAFNKADVISMKREPISSGAQVITIQSAKKPEFVGIDPYNKYIDRNSDDNIIAVDD